jgi:hypothetical protein
MPEAQEHLWNYPTENVRSVVRREVLNATRSRGKLFARPRIFNDLLSSQPLCFNLFGELALDLELASRTFQHLTHGRIARVLSIGFEHSPGRGDVTYTGDRSAFDVFVEYASATGAPGFVGIEVKYHEDLGDAAAPHRARYDELARGCKWWREDSLERLRAKPIQQMWRDHLLVAAILAAHRDRFEEGFFSICSPRMNEACKQAIRAYRGCVAEEHSFAEWSLEEIVAAIASSGPLLWLRELTDRNVSRHPVLT